MSPLRRSNEETAIDQVTGAFPGAEVQAAPLPGMPVVPPSEALLRQREEFRKVFEHLPWVDGSEAGFRLALQIASGPAESAGQEMEKRSVRELKLVNKVHVIREVALAESSFTESAGPDFYAIIDAVAVTSMYVGTKEVGAGEEFTYSIGGWIPLAQIKAKIDGRQLPWRCQIVTQASGKGNNPAYRYLDA